MSLTEFQLIERFFTRQRTRRDDVSLGIGDDAALLTVPNGRKLVVTVDTLISGVHFPEDTDAYSVGHKALAVNLSDLAAMGAQPAWATLALTLPAADEAWLTAFARGFFELADEFGVQLVGGDTTRGPLSITVQAMGHVEPGAALMRGGARPGDLIYVTGTLGDAGLALLALQDEVKLPVKDRESVLARLNRPTPRIHAGMALAGIANAAVDISDGLSADLSHILEAGGVGAIVQVERLPISEALRRHFDMAGRWTVPLTSGDDYELCFTVPSAKQAAAETALAAIGVPATWIGCIDARPGLHCLMDDGTEVSPGAYGYQHFGGRA
jgi:thiamine-monophosphate kinase